MIDVTVVHGQLTHGGSERQLYELLRRCDRDVFGPSLVISGALGFWEEPIRELDIPITLLGGSPVNKMRELRRLVANDRPDALLSWSRHTNPFVLTVANRGIRTTISFRNTRSSVPLPAPARAGEVFAMRSAAAIVSNSEEVFVDLARDVPPTTELYYVPNAIDPLDQRLGQTLRQRWRSELGVDPQTQLIVGVGRLHPQKNFIRFIDVVAKVRQHLNCVAVIAGPDKGQRAALEAHMNQLDVGDGLVRLIGEVPDARELVCAADAFLLSSDYEGMPNVVMEAMNAGVPVVSTRVNGVKALVEQGVHGFVCDDDAALADALCRVLGDKALALAMGEAGRKRIAERHNPKLLTARLWEIAAGSPESTRRKPHERNT
ncbi:MAG: glycosyltransferase [Actinomycetia bacterium]|nr:glycosyltransferase [Actinomycetes bacterium]MCP4960797.1 glycosyltransferase [Actinomycetes bacterium]